MMSGADQFSLNSSQIGNHVSNIQNQQQNPLNQTQHQIILPSVTADSHGNNNHGKLKTAAAIANKTALRFRSQDPQVQAGASRDGVPKTGNHSMGVPSQGSGIPTGGINTPMSIISGNTVMNQSQNQNTRYSSNNNKRGNGERQDQSPSPHQYFRQTQQADPMKMTSPVN